MNDDQPGPSAAYARGGRHSLLRSFSIEGLHGYRNIGLKSQYAATILIAKNGTGKTTLLGALDAFLRMQLGRLRDLEFTKIRCSLAGIEDELVLDHQDVLDFLLAPPDADLVKTAARAGIETKALFDFLIGEFNSVPKDDILQSDDKIVIGLKQAFAYNYAEIHSTLDRLAGQLYNRVENVARIRRKLQLALAEIDIVYLPTYRRIELALREESSPYSSRRRRAPRFNLASGSLYTGDIQFGLGDITDRLTTISNKIVISSNTGYGELSANIINELIDGSFEKEEIREDELPSKEELEIFFSRLKTARHRPDRVSVIAPNLDKLFIGEEIPPSSEKFLRYFLKQLGAVIEVTRQLEAPANQFIDSCNKYLSTREPSTERGTTSIGETFDGKQLKLSRKNLRVVVRSVPDGRKISLNALSSGEKQMISLFAKLFLYPKQKLVLIDEPELSLSIDWQSQILVDVLNAPLCAQVIAITHSPFIFENELDPFAQPLAVSRFNTVVHEDELDWETIDSSDELEDE